VTKKCSERTIHKRRGCLFKNDESTQDRNKKWFPGILPKALWALFLPSVFASCCVYEIWVRDFRLCNNISVAFTIYSYWDSIAYAEIPHPDLWTLLSVSQPREVFWRKCCVNRRKVTYFCGINQYRELFKLLLYHIQPIHQST
jgi:hypothetical protein